MLFSPDEGESLEHAIERAKNLIKGTGNRLNFLYGGISVNISEVSDVQRVYNEWEYTCIRLAEEEDEIKGLPSIVEQQISEQWMLFAQLDFSFTILCQFIWSNQFLFRKLTNEEFNRFLVEFKLYLTTGNREAILTDPNVDDRQKRLSKDFLELLQCHPLIIKEQLSSNFCLQFGDYLGVTPLRTRNMR